MLVNSFQHANTKNTNYRQWQEKNSFEVMIIDQRKAHAFISSLYIFIQHFHPIKEYIWIAGARTIVTLTVKNWP